MKKIYTMAPNYAAGQDVVKGFASTFKGEIVGQDFTKWGSDPQLDFSAEFSKVAASGADGLFAFYPGRSAAFMTQFEQSGLKDKVKLYTVYTLDQIALPALQKGNATGALGSVLTDYWYPDLDTPANRTFVDDFRKTYGRTLRTTRPPPTTPSRSSSRPSRRWAASSTTRQACARRWRRPSSTRCAAGRLRSQPHAARQLLRAGSRRGSGRQVADGIAPPGAGTGRRPLCLGLQDGRSRLTRPGAGH